jgi:hypothetical protein
MENEFEGFRHNPVALNRDGPSNWESDRTILLCVLELLLHTNRKINLLTQEVRIMASNDAALTQAVQDLLSAQTDNFAALDAEVASLKGAQSGSDSPDPVIDTAVTNIETIVTNLKASTAAAQAAIAPAPGTGSTDAPVDGDSPTATAS